MLRQGLMCALAATAIAACTPKGYDQIPEKTYEECIYDAGKTEFTLWAPEAEAVKLRLYSSAQEETPLRIFDMRSARKGLWTKTIREEVKGLFYTFQVCRNGEWLPETQGMAAKAVGVGGMRGAIIDWDETDPQGWAEDISPEIAPSDIIVYEMHHRDFSIHSTSGVKNKGKYLALTEQGTTNPDGYATGIDHLKELGITYVQLLPSTDFITVDETKLDTPQYNWGYDPLNYNAVEGSYSTDPYDPLCRIREFKQMIQALHKAGIRVILDVVYNHTTSADVPGFQRTNPGYFYRFNQD